MTCVEYRLQGLVYACKNFFHKLRKKKLALKEQSWKVFQKTTICAAQMSAFWFEPSAELMKNNFLSCEIF